MSTVAVIDASYILAFLLPDERVGAVDTVFDQYAHGHIKLKAPRLLPFEVLNALKAAVGQKRISAREGSTLALAFLSLGISLVDVVCEDVYALSFKRSLSVYDAAYVHMAGSLHVPLFTLDKRLVSNPRGIKA